MSLLEDIAEIIETKIDTKIDEFAAIMQRSFLDLEHRADMRFEAIDRRFDDLEGRFDALTNEVRGTQRRQGTLELQQEDTADTAMNHEERIIRLEIAGA